MLDFKKQEQIEKNYFKGNARGKKLFKAFEEYLWCLSGYTNPEEDFDYYDMTDAERKQVFKDYSNIKKDESYDMEKSCRDMLVSKVAYGWRQGETGLDLVSKDQSYLYKYIIVYGINTVAKWAQELIDTVDHVVYASGSDSEGCIYNSIIYKKDLENK